MFDHDEQPWRNPASAPLGPSLPDMRPLPAASVAEELRRRLPGLPLKKQHKLLYYCQGFHLATFDRALFTENLTAWDMGPVVGQLWYQEKNGVPSRPAVTLDEAELNTIGYVISRYGALSGTELERLTHQEPPWQEADRSRPPGGTARIDEGVMAAYFQTIDSEDDEGIAGRDVPAVAAWLAGATTRRRDDATRVDSLDDLRLRASG